MADEPTITVTTDGPYTVSGGLPLGRKEPIVSEHGEPLTWRPGDDLDAGDGYALCRCGQSSGKPFCDGSHAEADWDATDGAPEGTYAERAERYDGEGVTMVDDRSICHHAGFCGNERTDVWEMVGETDDTQVRSHLMAMVSRCPSGSLTMEVGGEAVEPELPTRVSVVPGGPLVLTGGVRVEREDGGPLETRNRMSLCRCGASSAKPLCDGTHRDIEWDG